jgi:proteasome assembly chaperone (PAC2) family protein
MSASSGASDPKSSNRISVLEHLKEPTTIVAFPGPGMVGSITGNYIIEYLHMYEVAFVPGVYCSWNNIHRQKVKTSISRICK